MSSLEIMRSENPPKILLYFYFLCSVFLMHSDNTYIETCAFYCKLMWQVIVIEFDAKFQARIPDEGEKDNILLGHIYDVIRLKPSAYLWQM